MGGGCAICGGAVGGLVVVMRAILRTQLRLYDSLVLELLWREGVERGCEISFVASWRLGVEGRWCGDATSACCARGGDGSGDARGARARRCPLDAAAAAACSR
jgi:hypothetical protein